MIWLAVLLLAALGVGLAFLSFVFAADPAPARRSHPRKTSSRGPASRPSSAEPTQQHSCPTMVNV